MSNWSHEIQTACPFYEDLLEPKIFSFLCDMPPVIQKIEFKFKSTADWKKQQKQAKRNGKDQEDTKNQRCKRLNFGWVTWVHVAICVSLRCYMSHS